MDERLSALRINPDRFQADFEALAQIGATGDGGVHRPALSPTHLAARAWFRQRIEEAGLQFHQDGAGNHSARLACGPENAPTLLLGSHLDSVPYGGRFDGPLGVLAALEALRTVQEAGISLPVHLEAIDFTDEEGTLVGELGSGALAGTLTARALTFPRSGRAALEAGLARAGLTVEGVLSARRDPASLAAYMELHIEQGARLVEAGVDVGVVTRIVGIGSTRLTFEGQADHAGTTPMKQRRDAALGASALTLAAGELVAGFPDCTVNVGDMRFQPGAFNIVPERVVLLLEFRAPDSLRLDRLEEALLGRARQEAKRFGLDLSVERLPRVEPAVMSPQIQDAFSTTAQALGLSYLPLVSYAGHDGQSLAQVCPAGMIFVPSLGGASHSSRELTPWKDCVNGANLLLGAALRFVSLDE